MGTGTHRVLWAVAGVLLLGMPHVAAQQEQLVNLSDEPGKWKPWTFSGFSPADLRSAGATAADARTFEAHVKQVADIVRATPVWNSPKGVDPMLTASALGRAMPKATPPIYEPLSAYILMGSFEHLAIGKDRHDPFVAGETFLVNIGVNRLPGALSDISLEDEEGALMKAPRRTGEMSGFPVYGGDVLVIAANGREPWTPVSRERYLKALVVKRRGEAKNAEAYIAAQQKLLEAFTAPEATAARQKKYADAIAKAASKGAAAVEHERRYWERDEADSLDQLKKGASRDPKVSHMAAIVAGLTVAEGQLAALSTAERGEQACFVSSDDPLKTGLVASGTSGCAPLVSVNTRFFDPALPRGVVQIVTVSRFADVEKGWKKGRPADGSSNGGAMDLWTTFEALRTTDWRKVAELLWK